MNTLRESASERGITLVQLLVIIAVIGILAGIAIPFYGNMRDKHKVAQALMELRNLQGLATYHVGEEGYVPTIQQLADTRSRSDSHIIGNYLIFSAMDGYSPFVETVNGYMIEQFVVCSIWDLPGVDYVYGTDDKPPRIARGSIDPLGGSGICGNDGSWGDQGDVVPKDCSGCDVDAACPCDRNWRNHGQYVSCVAHKVNQCVKQGLIPSTCKGGFVRRAAQSGCGQK